MAFNHLHGFYKRRKPQLYLIGSNKIIFLACVLRLILTMIIETVAWVCVSGVAYIFVKSNLLTVKN